MNQVAEFFATLGPAQPMTPDQVREFTRRAWADKQEAHGAADRERMAEMLRGE